MKVKIIIIFGLLIFSPVSCKENDKEAIPPLSPTEKLSTIDYDQNRFDSIKETANSGNDFKGGGDKPFWSVEISDKNLRFESRDKNYESLATTIDIVDASGSTITFTSESQSESIKLALIEQECIDVMSGKKNSHKVEVAIKLNNDKNIRIYEGCGSFMKK